jgi:hypothetical protein
MVIAKEFTGKRRNNSRQRPNNEKSQEQENSDATSGVSCLSKAFGIVGRVCVSDISIVSVIID